ncbi:MAG: response regulator [Lachnospiraceae bacterium]|nr:response regulator [Lachnospiraceae bacterium]
MGKVILAVKVIFFVVLFISLAGLLYFSSIDRFSSISYGEPTFIEEWTMTTPDGQEIRAASSYRNEATTRGIFTLRARLPEKIKENSWFCFIVGGDVSVYVNDELRSDFVAARDVVVPGGCVKRFYMRVPLTSEDAGAEIRIDRIVSTRSGYVYQNTFIADDAEFFKFMMSHYGLSFLLEALLLIFSVIIVLVSLVMMLLYRRRIEMLYGAMSILVIAGWLITNSYLYPFLFGHYHVDGVMNYMLCLMMPFCLVFYLDALQHGRYRNIMRVVLCVAALNLLVWPALHFTSVFPFPSALLYIDLFLGVELLIVAGILIVDLIRGGMKEYKYTAVGLSGFLICGVGEIIVLNFLPVINGDVLMLTGLAFMLALAVVQQMSDLRRVREEGLRAVDLSEAKTKFLASMSHEIRTPINAVLGMNEMILRENKDPVIGEYASSVRSSGQMLLMLVNDVLDFSKIEAGKMEINSAAFHFSSLLRDIMPMLQERAYEKNLDLRVELVNEVPDGQISDEFRIRQILINLINNAIKYTDAGSVRLLLGGAYTSEDSYRLRMSVKDTGRGIREEDQKHLFEAFTRADVKKNRSIEGTGLGLAIVKSIVDSMGGEISVVSRYGEGSEFIVELPVKVSDRTPLTEDYEKNSQKTSSGTGECDYLAPDASILAVDDNHSNLKIVKLFLKRVGIVPELCDNGTKAIELCKQKKYDLILLDHMMPDPDGIKTLGIIRSEEDSMNRDTPVVVLTANAIAGIRQTYTDAGFADYLTKPIDSSLLEQTIKKYLPAEKILPAEKEEPADPDVMIFEPPTLRESLEMIDGLDYEAALNYAGGDEELLRDVIRIIVSECDEKISNLRESIASEDWERYSIETHAVKGLLASIGLKSLSDRARKHEYAGKDRDAGFILSDSEGFISAYREVCDRLKSIPA